MSGDSDIKIISTASTRLKDETKEKFDALLKQALNSKNRKNAKNETTQKLNIVSECLTNTESSSSSVKTQKVAEVVEVDVHGEYENENFILNKFLHDSIQIQDIESGSIQNDLNEVSSSDVKENVLFIKPPVPRPRKNKTLLSNSPSTGSSGTAATYNVVSPKLTKEEKEANESKDVVKTNAIISSDSENEKEVFEPSQIARENKTEANFIEYENEVASKPKKRQSKNKSKQEHTFKEKVEDVIDNKNEKYKYDKIIGIVIHKTDRLKLDSLVIHPVVKVHIVDSDSGKYLNKSNNNRAAVFFHENLDIAYITPIISEPYNLYEKRCLVPSWEETLLINDDLNYLTAPENSTIIFFEIMDFVPFAVASAQTNKKSTSRGWHKVAWAFFKPVGMNNALNINKKVRLQLYYPGKHKQVLPNFCDIFHWWHSKKLSKYPASLYVTVKGVIPPEKVVESLRSKTPFHGDKASKVVFNTETNVENIVDTSNSSHKNEDFDVVAPEWSRQPHQNCRLPNKYVAKFSGYEEGCLTMKFSNNGLYLACAAKTENVYSTIVLSVKTYKEVCKYSAHQGLIHSIRWSLDDRYIITASADCTVCIWDFNANTFFEMLPHPSYVYAVEINNSNVVVTGSHDHVIRIWCVNENSYNLIQELEGHKSYITSLCFNNSYTTLFSSDAMGKIMEWKLDAEYTSKREIKLAELNNTIINQILLHPREKRLLIHARDSCLRIIDIKTSCVLYWLQGAVNNKVKISCSLSPCGSFVFGGSENGFVHVWSFNLGHLVATYSPYNDFPNLPIHCVQFHPIDNIVAVSHYGNSFPILVIVHDSTTYNENINNVGLKILHSDGELTTSTCRFIPNKLKVSVNNVGDGEEENKRINFEDVIKKIDKIVNVGRLLKKENSSRTINNEL